MDISLLMHPLNPLPFPPSTLSAPLSTPYPFNPFSTLPMDRHFGISGEVWRNFDGYGYLTSGCQCWYVIIPFLYPYTLYALSSHTSSHHTHPLITHIASHHLTHSCQCWYVIIPFVTYKTFPPITHTPTIYLLITHISSYPIPSSHTPSHQFTHGCQCRHAIIPFLYPICSICPLITHTLSSIHSWLSM